MQFREFGKTGEKVSALGFGCMRLPVIDGDQTKIDDEKAIAMLRHAIDRGVNYVDTAYPYHGSGFDRGGESEPFVARALKDGYREKVKIATKLPTWLCTTKEDMFRYLDEQLERLETESIDFYLVHALNKSTWSQVEAQIGEFLDEALEQGKIKHAGFSFHDDVDTFYRIVDAYDWSFCQIQYNYLDENYQAGKKGLEYAATRGLGIAIMEPLRGGSLTKNIPEQIMDKWNEVDSIRTPVHWALKWVLNHSEVSVVLSGMSEMDHVVDNIETTLSTEAGSLSSVEVEAMDYAKNVFNERVKINCTGCRYCMPCPVGVDIPQNFSLYNNGFLFDDIPMAKVQYMMVLAENSRASKCIECGKCEGHCPQNIPIREELKNVVATLA